MKIIKELIPYIIITIVVILIRSFVISPVRVDGLSMYPTLNNNDYLLLNKFDKSYERFDIIALKYKDEKLVKRIIGLPGEYVEYLDNKLYIDGKIIEEKFLKEETGDFNLTILGYDKVPNNCYFVVGDNRDNSQDSRIIGFINKDDILGIVLFNVSKFKKTN